MLDYIPFTKGEEDEIKVTSGTGGGKQLKNQKQTLKFLQNKQNYAKINKVADYQTLLNSPEQITTRSMDIQQYEYYLRKIPVDYNDKNVKISKGQQTILPKKILQQPMKVENIHLGENIHNFKKLETALNKSKFNRGGSIGETYRSQDSLSSIQQITRYQILQQQVQSYLDVQLSEDQNVQQQQIADQSLTSIKFEDQNKIEQCDQQHNDIVQESMIDHQNTEMEQQEDQTQQIEEQQSQNNNESYIQSQYSVPQNYSINNEISLINYEDDELNEDEEYEDESKVEIQKKKKEKKQKLKQPREKKNQQQQNNSQQQTVNQSIQSVKKSDIGRSNKVSRQQSQKSLSDMDRVEQIIQQNANDLDQAEIIQRDKMRQQIRELEERIQKTKDRQDQFVYQAEDYNDMSGQYLQSKKILRETEQSNQQIQLNLQQQQQQQSQQSSIHQQQQQQQVRQPVKQDKKIQPAKIQQPVTRQNKNKQSDNQNQSAINNANHTSQQEEASQREKSVKSDGSIELENQVIKSLRELEQFSKNNMPQVQLPSDPIIRIENKLKQIQEDIESTERQAAKQDFADYLLNTKNVFEVQYDEFKIFHFTNNIDDPPGHIPEEDKILYSHMKNWDAQNTGNSKKINAVADIVRGIQTKLTSDANISEPDIKTQKSIDSDWD